MPGYSNAIPNAISRFSSTRFQVTATLLTTAAIFTILRLTPTGETTGNKIWEAKSGSGSSIYVDEKANLAASGYIASRAIPNCTSTKTTSTGMIICGTDSTGASSGNVIVIGDRRYLKKQGDTATGGLLIQSGTLHGTLPVISEGMLLEVAGSMSGRLVHATYSLNTSGTLIVDGNATFKNDISILGDNIEATTETDRFVFMANGSTYAPEAINLGTDTTGNYAAGDAEAGAALTGDSATAFFSTGTQEVGVGGTGFSSCTDGGFVTGNGAAALTCNAILSDNQIYIGDGTTEPTATALPECTSSQKIQYTDAGNGLTCVTDIDTQSLFQTIAVSGQSDVVADSATDTLTLAAGSNITLTTNAGTDTVTIASSGGGGTFGTGNVITIGDSRYVFAQGDTMTGGLLIQSGTLHGALPTISDGLLLEVAGTASGKTLHAETALSSSGQLIVEEGPLVFTSNTANDAVFNLLSTGDFEIFDGSNRIFSVVGETGKVTINESSTSTADFHVQGDNVTNLLYADVSADFIGIGTATPKTTFDVLGTISGSALVIGGTTRFNNVAYTWPKQDGTASGRVLATNGAGVLTWTATSGGTKPNREYCFDAGDMKATPTSFAPLETLSGAVAQVRTYVRSFDDTVPEYVAGKLQAPGDINTSGTVTFRLYVMAKTAAASKNLQFRFGHYSPNDSASYTGAFTNEDSADFAIDATQDDLTEATWTETVSNLAWAANDLVFWRLGRIDATANDLSGDAYVHHFCVEIPRT